ncbi:hypothetical protein LguiA_023851 [Lonicera macranthoides]
MGPLLLDTLLLLTYLSFLHSNFYNLYNLQRYDDASVRFVLFSIHNFTVIIFTMLGPVRIWRIKLDADEHSSGLMNSVAINLSGIILYAMGRILGLNESRYFDIAGVITIMLLSLYILLMIRLISPCMVSSVILPDFFAVMGLYMSLVLSEHHEASAVGGRGCAMENIENVELEVSENEGDTDFDICIEDDSDMVLGDESMEQTIDFNCGSTPCEEGGTPAWDGFSSEDEDDVTLT